MSLLGLTLAALPLGVYYATRFVDPARLARCTVTRLEGAEVGVLLAAPNRGVHAISLNHQRYSGFAAERSKAMPGSRVDAYVIAEHRIVPAIEPRATAR